jgi:3-hydroxyacyl-CoA dehydrogenase/3-hydroxy-2-methylbutyryl-CoA dehydrogenase
MEIENSVALITGGASGLGEGAARFLVDRGGRVAILDLVSSAGADVAEDLGPAAAFFPTDVRDPEAVQASVAGALEAFGRIDINVNAAGVAPPARVVGRDGTLFPLDLFKFVIDVNLVGLFDVARNCAAAMQRNEPNAEGERGLIVNVASIAAFEGQVGQAAYAASKGGVVSLTLTLARDLASSGIRVMTVAPGIMDTAMLAAAPEELKESLAGLHVFPKRLGTAEDFARLVAHLVENPMLNGEVVRLDAGARMPPR